MFSTNLNVTPTSSGLFSINITPGGKLMHKFTKLLYFVLCSLMHVPVYILQPSHLYASLHVFVYALQLGQSNTGPNPSAGNPWSGLHCANRWMCGGQQSLRKKLHQPHPQLISGNASKLNCMTPSRVSLFNIHNNHNFYSKLFRDSWLLCCTVLLMGR